MKEHAHAGVAPAPRREEMERLQSVTLQIPAGEVTLAGDLEISQSPRGLVLFAHGSGSSRRSPRNQAVAERLRDAGLATLLFDLLTPPEEIEDAYSGHLRFDIGLLSRRLAVVTQEIADDSRSRNLGLGYFGASTGGAAALRAAAALGRSLAQSYPAVADQTLPAKHCAT